MYIPAALDLERPKRPRTTFTERQLHVLERQFEDNHFISEARRQTLAMELGLTETQVRSYSFLQLVYKAVVVIIIAIMQT